MPPRTLVRHARDYPRAHFDAAKRIALKAAPTLNEEYDDPPMAGPFKTANAIKIYRAEWHNFRELLRLNGDFNSPATKMYRILRSLTSKMVVRLKPDGTEEFWIEFAPHPFTLNEWRMNPELFEAEQRQHASFVEAENILRKAIDDIPDPS